MANEITIPHGGADQIFRDYAVDDVPGPKHRPIKSEVRTWGQQIEDYLWTTISLLPDDVTDLDNIVKNCKFFVDDVSTILHLPVWLSTKTVGFFESTQVDPAGTQRNVQRYTELGTGRAFHRTYDGSAWGPWATSISEVGDWITLEGGVGIRWGVDSNTYMTHSIDNDEAISFFTAGTRAFTLIENGITVGEPTSLMGLDGSVGGSWAKTGFLHAWCTNTAAARLGRSNDGTIVQLGSGTTIEGTISVSGTTISYGSFCGTHESMLQELEYVLGFTPTIYRGTVLESVDELCDWPELSDEAREARVGEYLPRFKISDIPASRAVYGVFHFWDDNGNANIASLGVYPVRVQAIETVLRGDLLVSAGNGCAMLALDDIVRSNVIGKVVSGVVIDNYPDGSYTVACALYCG